MRHVFAAKLQSAFVVQMSSIWPAVQRPAEHTPLCWQLGSVATATRLVVGVCQLRSTSPAALPATPTRRFGSAQISAPSFGLQPQVVSSESQSPSLSASPPAPGTQTPPWQVSLTVHSSPSLQRTPFAAT
jgi:hypothetical protein